jgi:hypothetical protein
MRGNVFCGFIEPKESTWKQKSDTYLDWAKTACLASRLSVVKIMCREQSGGILANRPGTNPSHRSDSRRSLRSVARDTLTVQQ